jgi:hypothetical protein
VLTDSIKDVARRFLLAACRNGTACEKKKRGRTMQQDETAFYERIYRRADGAGRSAMLEVETPDFLPEVPREHYYVAVRKDDVSTPHAHYGEWLLSQKRALPHQSNLMGEVALVAAPDEATPKAQYLYLAGFLSELKGEGVHALLWSLPEEAVAGSRPLSG